MLPNANEARSRSLSSRYSEIDELKKEVTELIEERINEGYRDATFRIAHPGITKWLRDNDYIVSELPSIAMTPITKIYW